MMFLFLVRPMMRLALLTGDEIERDQENEETTGKPKCIQADAEDLENGVACEADECGAKGKANQHRQGNLALKPRPFVGGERQEHRQVCNRVHDCKERSEEFQEQDLIHLCRPPGFSQAAADQSFPASFACLVNFLTTRSRFSFDR